MRDRIRELSPAEIDRIVGWAWADRVSFEEIENRSGLPEADVIKVMRRELKGSSFRRWRARVSGRGTKHRRKFEREQKGAEMDDY